MSNVLESGTQNISAPCGLRGCKNRPALFPKSGPNKQHTEKKLYQEKDRRSLEPFMTSDLETKQGLLFQMHYIVLIFVAR